MPQIRQLANLPFIPVNEQVEAIARETARIAESVDYSAQAQFEQAKLWRGMHLLVGVPAAICAAVAGAAAFASAAGRIPAAILALVAAGLGAVSTTIDATKRSDGSQRSGNDYLDLLSRIRVFREADLPVLRVSEAREELDKLMNRRHEINQASTAPSFYAYWRARRNISKGRTQHEVDQG